MQNSIKVEIGLFGAFRQFAGGAPFAFEVPQGTRLGEIRNALRTELVKRHPEFRQQKLMEVSVLADERSILRDDAVLLRDTTLAILPPVGGG